MTAPLEARYRRLLTAYPASHREMYEEEMLAVLMQGARADQRRPTLGEMIDLLSSGIAARVSRGLGRLRGAGWRDAAAVAGLVGAVVLAAAPLRRVLLSFATSRRFDHPVDVVALDHAKIDAGERTLIWLLVVTAVVLGARRTAAALGVAGLLVELASIAGGTPQNDFLPVSMSWAMMLSALVATLLVLARRGRPTGAVLGRTGTALVASPLAVGAAVGVLVLTLPGAIRWLTDADLSYALHRPPVLLLVMLACVPVVAVFWRVPSGVRGRSLVLLAPLGAVPVAQSTMEAAIDMQFAMTMTPVIVVTDVLLMIGLPLLAFVTATAALYARENLTVSLRRPPA